MSEGGGAMSGSGVKRRGKTGSWCVQTVKGRGYERKWVCGFKGAGLRAEVVSVRAEVSSLRAEMALLRSNFGSLGWVGVD